MAKMDSALGPTKASPAASSLAARSVRLASDPPARSSRSARENAVTGVGPPSVRAAFTAATAAATDAGFPVMRISPALADAGNAAGTASTCTSITLTNVVLRP